MSTFHFELYNTNDKVVHVKGHKNLALPKNGHDLTNCKRLHMKQPEPTIVFLSVYQVEGIWAYPSYSKAFLKRVTYSLDSEKLMCSPKETINEHKKDSGLLPVCQE